MKSVNEAIAMTNAGDTPLAAYVFEQNAGIRSRWLTEVESGGATVNDCLMHVISMEESGLTGKGESGMGRNRGKAAFNTFTHRKTVAFQSPSFDPLIKYPPYKPGSTKLVKMILLGEFPWWVVLTFWGVVGALTLVAFTVVGTWLSQNVSFSVSLEYRKH